MLARFCELPLILSASCALSASRRLRKAGTTCSSHGTALLLLAETFGGGVGLRGSWREGPVAEVEAEAAIAIFVSSS